MTHPGRQRRTGRMQIYLLVLLVAAGICSAQNASPPSSSNARDAKLLANFRLLGQDVLPFTSQKQNAVIVGVANTLGGGILASDIVLTVYATYNSISATGSGSRRLLQQQTTFPGADIGLNITTSKSQADSQAQTLNSATNETYQLSSAIGAQGLQTQQIVLQSTNVQNASPSTPPPANAPPPNSPSPPPKSQSPPPPPAASPPPPQAQAPTSQSPAPSESTPATTPAPTTSGSASSNSASTSSGGSSFPIGAIIGIVAGVVVLAIVIGFLIFMRRRRRQFAHQGEVIDYFSDLGKQGSQNAGAGALPVVATSAKETQDRVPLPRRASREHNHVFSTSVSGIAEVPVTDIAEVPTKAVDKAEV